MWNYLLGKSIFVPNITSAEIDKQLEPVLRGMEEMGIKLDIEEFAKLESKLSANRQRLTANIFQLAGFEFNLDSPSQMAEVLFDKLRLPQAGLKRTKSGVSTAASELKKIIDQHQIIAPILKYRELSKLISTYLMPLPKMVDKNNRLHTHYSQDVSTGRLASSNPNLQNIPIKGEWGEEIRKSFIADIGKVLIAADYSQIELRIVACLAEDKAMIESFKSGRDIHTDTAADIFKKKPEEISKDERRFAKTINFGVLYGMSSYGLSQSLNIGQDTAAEYIRRYKEVYSGINDYCKRMIDFAKKNGYVETLFGFRRELPEISSYNRFTAETNQRMAINSPVQGTAAEILKLSMLELYRKFNIQDTRNKTQTNSKKLAANTYNLKHGEAKLLLTVHDELVVEAPEEEANKVADIIKETMENVVKLCVPIEVELGIGENWSKAKG